MSTTKEKQITKKIIIGTIAAISILYLFKSGKSTVAEAPPLLRVSTQKISNKTEFPFVTLHGTTEALQLATIKATFDTDILNTFAVEGHQVKKGHTLFILNCTEPELELQKTKAKHDNLIQNLKMERNNLENAQKSLVHEKKLLKLIERSVARYNALFKKNVGSAANLDNEKQRFHEQSLKINQTQLNIQNHGASIKLIQSNLDENAHQQAILKNDISYCEPKAPFNGVILKRFVSKGDRVNNGATLATLFDNKAIVIRAQIPQKYVHVLRKTQDQHQMISAYDSHMNAFQVSSINHDSRNTEGSFEILFTPEKEMKLPILGHVEKYKLILPSVKNSFSIPSKSIFGNNKVFKVVNQKLVNVPITVVGPAWSKDSSQNNTLIKSSHLKYGDEIITTPLPQARTGLRVEINNAQTTHKKI